MADKIKRYEFGTRHYEADLEEVAGGSLMLYTDHQAAMREAWKMVHELREELEDILYAEFSQDDTKNKLVARASAFLAAHQECGGGGE